MKYYKILFSILVLIVLTIPLFNMNMAEITEQENRTLVKFPEIKNKDGINGNYGKEFESWLGDRFWGRDQLIKSRFQVLYKINGRIENEKFFISGDGWMFGKKLMFQTFTMRKQIKTIDRVVMDVKSLNEKIKDTNTLIYLILVPTKEQLFKKNGVIITHL